MKKEIIQMSKGLAIILVFSYLLGWLFIRVFEIDIRNNEVIQTIFLGMLLTLILVLFIVLCYMLGRFLTSSKKKGGNND